MRYVYPRLPLSRAMALLEEHRACFEAGGYRALEEAVAYSHPHAAPVATGGRVALHGDIEKVRLAVLEEMGPLLDRRTDYTRDSIRFDVTLGNALHSALAIVPADAAHDDTWSFLTLVVFPDLAARRFRTMHDDRMLGRPRNVLRRVWQRAEVLGDALYEHPRPLGEDEAVGLFERTALARNRRLVRIAALEVMDSRADNRSQWAREMYKFLQYRTGPLLLDALNDEDLLSIVREASADATAVMEAERV